MPFWYLSTLAAEIPAHSECLCSMLQVAAVTYEFRPLETWQQPPPLLLPLPTQRPMTTTPLTMLNDVGRYPSRGS